MNPFNELILQAFVSALAQLTGELPPAVQAELNQLGKSLAAGDQNISSLDRIAQSYPPLDTLYHQELAKLEALAVERNKGLNMPPLSEELTAEIGNTVSAIFSANNSIVAAKEELHPNLWQKVIKFLQGN